MERWNHGVRLFGVSILAQKRLLAVNAAIFPPSAPFLSALVPEPILQYSITPFLLIWFVSLICSTVKSG
jgi:hypothetical protein